MTRHNVCGTSRCSKAPTGRNRLEIFPRPRSASYPVPKCPQDTRRTTLTPHSHPGPQASCLLGMDGDLKGAGEGEFSSLPFLYVCIYEAKLTALTFTKECEVVIKLRQASVVQTTRQMEGFLAAFSRTPHSRVAFVAIKTLQYNG